MIKKMFLFIWMLQISLVALLSCVAGCGGGDDPPAPPKYKEDPYTTELKKILVPKVREIAETPYEDWESRFTLPEQEITTQATSRLSGFMGEGYDPTSYEEYRERFTPETSDLMTGALEKYQGLFDEQDYSGTDYAKTEQEYLDTVLRKYGEAREKAFEPVQEGLMAENLYSSGPGYGMMRDFGEKTAEGVADITKQWAYEGIERQKQQQQYQDALKRGDYSSMYNLAISEETRKMQPVKEATEMANLERNYYDALERGDAQTAFNIGQLLKQSELYPIEKATAAQFGAVTPASGLFGQLSGVDMAKHEAAMQGYQANLNAMNQPKKNLGGIGTALGVGAGLLLAPVTAGASLGATAAMLGTAGALGGAMGGGVGSMVEY